MTFDAIGLANEVPPHASPAAARAVKVRRVTVEITDVVKVIRRAAADPAPRLDAIVLDLYTTRMRARVPSPISRTAAPPSRRRSAR